MIDFTDRQQILICGNGGLAAESEHFAAELMGKYAFDVTIPCIALTANSSLLTALANDFGYEEVFAHQVRSLGRPHDILIGMTTSQSPNIIRALEAGRLRGMYTLVLCGENSHIEASQTIRLRGKDTREMQESAMVTLHALAFDLKREIHDRLQRV